MGMGLKKGGRVCDNCKKRKPYDFDRPNHQWFGSLGEWQASTAGYTPINTSFIDAHNKQRELIICQKCADILNIKTLDQPEVFTLFLKLKNELLTIQKNWLKSEVQNT